MGLLRSGEHEQARGVAVEPMHDPGPVRVAARDPAAQRIDERVRRVTGPRVHDQAGRLVDHEQMLVLPDDPRWWRRRGGRRLPDVGQLDRLAAGEPVALHSQLPIDQCPRVDRTLRRAARTEVRRQELVEALARRGRAAPRAS